jgi:hypothetical protein
MATEQTNKKSADYPTPMDINLSKSALQIKMTCRDCIHLKRMAYPSYKKPCFDLGITEESKPCENFAPNPANISFTESKRIRQAALIIQELSERERKNLAVILNQETRTRRYKFTFGEKVYFKLYGGNYLKNYVAAKVVWADSKHVHIQGVDGYIASLHHNSVFRQAQWNKLEFELIRDNKIYDPSRARYDKVPTKAQLEMQKLEKPMPLDLSAALDGKGPLAKAVTSRGAKLPTRNMPLDRFLMVRG